MAKKKSEVAVEKKPTRARRTNGVKQRTAQPAADTAAKVVTSTAIMQCSKEQIRERAYYIYLERRGYPGNPIDDWHQAEMELNGCTCGTEC